MLSLFAKWHAVGENIIVMSFPGSCDMQWHQADAIPVGCVLPCYVTVTGVSIPADGGGLLTSCFNTDLQPRVADNGEGVVFGHDGHASKGTDAGPMN